jgi:hypothetical protein
MMRSESLLASFLVSIVHYACVLRGLMIIPHRNDQVQNLLFSGRLVSLEM